MFTNLRADFRRYRQHGLGNRPRWLCFLILPYVHPAALAVLWYRFGATAWRCRFPVLRQLLQLLYLLLMPLVRFATGVQIQPTTPIGPGLMILHFGAVIITRQCRLGANATLCHNVSIGTTNTRQGAVIGDNLYMGVGASIMGNLIIQDNVICAAGSVVVKSVPKDAIVAGVPARITRFRRKNERPPKVVVGHHTPAPFLEAVADTAE